MRYNYWNTNWVDKEFIESKTYCILEYLNKNKGLYRQQKY